jgi:hypothetical protein
MGGFSAGLESALQQSAVLVFVALEIELPGHTIRLLDGAGSVTFDGKTFAGKDETYGVLGGVEPLNDGTDGETPVLTITLLPPTNTAAAELCDPALQGAPVSLWFGAIDPADGGVLGEPDLAFLGALDVPVLKVEASGRSLEIEVASVLERFFRDDEGARLTDAFHQKTRPGEKGFEFVTEVQRQLPWGSDQPRPNAVRDVSASPFGGGFELGDIF